MATAMAHTTALDSSAAERAELRAIIDEELARLPEGLRAVVVLCDLGGRSRSEAALELGCPEGTIAARLHRARKVLAERLTKRGIALPAAGLTVVTPELSAAVPGELAQTTLVASESFARGGTAVVSPTVQTLAVGVMHSMKYGTFKLMLAAVLAAGLMAGASAFLNNTAIEPRADAADPPKEKLVVPSVEVASGQWKETSVLETPGLAASTAFSPDGTTMLVGTGSHVKAYDTTAWKALWEYRDETGGAFGVAFSADGKTVAATTRDGAHLLNAASGKLEHDIEEKDSLPIAVAFLPNPEVITGGVKMISSTRRLLFGNAGGYYIKTWRDIAQVSGINLQAVSPPKKPESRYSAPLAVDPSGNRVAVRGPFDPKTGKNVFWAWAAGSGAANKLLDGHKGAVVSAAWSKDGKTLVSGDTEGEVITWDAVAFKEKSRLKLGGRVAALAISPDGSRAAAAMILPALVKPEPAAVAPRVNENYMETVVVWNAKSADSNTSGAKVETVSRHPAGGSFEGMASVSFTPDGQTLAASFFNFQHLAFSGELVGKVRIFTLKDAKPKASEPVGAESKEWIFDMAFSPDGKHIATSPGVSVRNLDGKVLYRAAGQAGQFTADGKHLLVAGENSVALHDAESGKIIAQYPKPKGNVGWHSAAFSPDGKRYAAHLGFEVRIYDTETGFEPLRLSDAFEPTATIMARSDRGLAWSASGKHLVAVGVLVANGKMGAGMWDTTTGKRTHVFESTPNHEPICAAFSLNGDYLAIGYKDRAEAWYVGPNEATKNPERIYRTDGSVTAIAYDAKTARIALGVRKALKSRDDSEPEVFGHKSEVAVFDVKTGKEIESFENLTGNRPTKLSITAIAFSPDGTHLAAGAGIHFSTPGQLPKSGEVKVWSLAP